MRIKSRIITVIATLLFCVLNNNPLQGQIVNCEEFSKDSLLKLKQYYDSLLPPVYRTLDLDSLKSKVIETKLATIDTLKLSLSRLSEEYLMKRFRINDSIVRLYVDINYFKEAKNSLEKAIEIRNLINLSEKDQIQFMIIEAFVYFNLREYSESIQTLDNALKILDESENNIDSKYIITIYNFLIINYIEKGEIIKGFKYKYKFKKILQDPDNQKYWPVYYNTTADLYRKFGQWDSAKCFLLESLHLKLKDKDDNLPSLAKTFNNLGEVYEKKGAFDSALLFHELGLKIKKRISHKYPFIDAGTSLMNKGLCLYHSGDKLERVFYYYDTTIYIQYQNRNFQEIPEVVNYYAEYLNNSYPDIKDSILRARDSLLACIQYSDEKSPDRRKTYKWLYKSYLKLGDSTKALEYLIELNKFDTDLTKQKQILNKHYLDLYEKGKLNLEQRSNQLQNLVRILYIGISFLVLLLIAVFYLYIINRRANKVIRIKDKTISSDNKVIVNTVKEISNLEKVIDKMGAIDSETLSPEDKIFKMEKQLAKKDGVIKTLKDQIESYIDKLVRQRQNIILEEGATWLDVKGDITGQVIIGSTLNNVRNKIENNEGKETLKLFNNAVASIRESEQEQAIRYLNFYTQEYEKENPDKSKLTKYWNKIQNVLKGVQSVIEFGSLISGFIL